MPKKCPKGSKIDAIVSYSDRKQATPRKFRTHSLSYAAVVYRAGTVFHSRIGLFTPMADCTCNRPICMQQSCHRISRHTLGLPRDTYVGRHCHWHWRRDVSMSGRLRHPLSVLYLNDLLLDTSPEILTGLRSGDVQRLNCRTSAFCTRHNPGLTTLSKCILITSYYKHVLEVTA